MKKPKILIVDDDRAVCQSLLLLLKKSGFECQCVNRPQEILETISIFNPDLTLLDMNYTIDTSGKKGLEMLNKIIAADSTMNVILMTGWATVQLAVEGMKAGAKDFIAKPWDNKKLLESIRTILKLTKPIPEGISDSYNFENIIGADPAFKDMLQMAQHVARTNASVLIQGESGTGKELIAEAIHYESQRADRPFVKVNLGGISSSLFESEMFGHKKGAFTDAVVDRRGRFEMANTGTIFLDEIGDLPLSNQVKLLRVLQEHTYEVLGSSETKRIDVRVISATNKDLETMVNQNLFREDFYYRINLIKIVIPPLRERPTDIPLLVDFFIKNLRNNYEKPNLTVHKNAMEWLTAQSFPGNIRQLKNLVERTVLIATKDELTASDFQQQYRKPVGEAIALPDVGKISLEEMEIKMIKKAMAFHNNKVSATARSLGLTRSALYRRLAKYDIPYDE